MASATKQALLAALSAAQGECISGQQLARQLGVSRAAVHKPPPHWRLRLCSGSRPPAGLSAGGRRPLLRRGGGGVRRPHLPLRQAGKFQPHGQDAGPRGCAPRHDGADKSADSGPGPAGAAVREPGGERHLSLAGAAARPAHDRGAGRHRQRGGGRLPGCEAALRLDLGIKWSTTSIITARRSAVS